MARTPDITLRIHVLSRTGVPLGGTVDVEIANQTLSDRVVLRNVSADEPIVIEGLHRLGPASYDVRVSTRDPLEVQSQSVLIPRTGEARLEFTFDRPRQTPPGTPTPSPDGFRVLGRISRVDGASVTDVVVHAFDHDLRSEEPLGAAPTGKDGEYEIRYSAGRFARKEKATADLTVRVIDANNTELARSPIRFNAKPEEIIDLVLGGRALRGPSEFAVISQELRPLLGELQPTDLTEDDKYRDLSFLSGETGRDIIQLAHFALAHRRERDTKLDAELFYGLFRDGIPTQLPLILQQTDAALREALRKASRRKTVRLLTPQEIDAFLAALRKAAIDQATNPDGGDGTAAAQVIGLAVSPALRQRFFELYIDAKDEPEAFWRRIEASAEFRDHAPRLKAALQLGAITSHHRPLVARLLEEGGSGPAFLEQLAGRRARDWEEIFTKQPDLVPDDVPGADAAEKRAAYARTLASRLEEAYPTAAVIGQAPGALPEGQQLASVLSKSAGFHIVNTHIDAYYAERPHLLAEVENRDAFLGRLKQLQRVYRVSGSFANASTLMADNWGSAFAISQRSQTEFLGQYGGTFGTTQALVMHERARQVSSIATTVVAMLASSNNKLPTVAVPTFRPADVGPVEGVPDLETLFGSADLCECEHCNSAHGPAAYFVDILSFLRQRNSRTPGRNVKQILFDRRPDLGEIELTCENTNTPVPYVDLVNELLEDAVAQIAGRPRIPASARQTRLSAGELAAHPEHLNGAAYEVLREAVHPWLLPFDLWMEEARVYLEHLGVERHELMRDLQRGATPSELEIATESLRITAAQRNLITQPLPNPAQPWTGWGLAQNGNVVVNPADPTVTIALNWLALLRNVRLFLDRAELAYADLEELLRLRFSNPGGAMRIVAVEGADPVTCDTALLEIQGLDAAAADRLRRFLRLQRHLGWTSREVDQAIVALQPGTLTDAFVEVLAGVSEIRREINLPLLPVLAFFSTIETTQYDVPEDPKRRSWYRQLFQSPTVVRLNPGEADPFALNAAGTDLAVARSLVAAAGDSVQEADLKRRIRTALLGVLAVGDDAFTAMVEGPLAVVTPDRALSLENLSRLYRTATLANALSLPIADLLLLIDLAGVNPFLAGGGASVPADVRRTVRFIEIARKVAASGFSVSDLDYILRHRLAPASELEPSADTIAGFLRDLRSALRKVQDDTRVLPDADGTVTAKRLAQLQWERERIGQIVAALQGNLTYDAPLAAGDVPAAFPAAIAPRISYDADSGRLRFRGLMTLADRALLLGVSTGAAYDGAVGALFQTPRDFLSLNLKAYRYDPFAAPLPAPPPALTFPPDLRGRVFVDASDPAAPVLRFAGFMTPAERATLLDVSADAGYQAAVNTLFGAPAAFVPAADNQLFTAAEINTLLDAPSTPQERFGAVVERVSSFLRRTLSEGQVIQKFSEHLGLSSGVTGALLRQWTPAAPGGGRALAVYLDPAYAESDERVALTAAAFTSQFQTYILLRKIALVLTRVRATTEEQLTWVFFDAVTGQGFANTAGWLNLATLPAAAAAPPSAFSAMERLLDLFRLRDTRPWNARGLHRVLQTAHAGGAGGDVATREAMAAATGWDLERIELMSGANGFAFVQPDAFRDERALVRLTRGFALLKRTGAPSDQAFAWATAQLTESDSRNIRQAAKSRHDDEEWRTIAKRLRDPLRDRQRPALAAWLVQNPLRNAAARPLWTDTYGLYQHVLVDVEMTSCQMTSRLKQAAGAVQLFVQRCRLNLEPQVSADAGVDRAWLEWMWRRNYRVWEANRKVFLYPENWIEPGLHPDKSPFFKDLENELLQGDVTLESAERAFLGYLEKLETVSRLYVVTQFIEKEGTSGALATDILHVIARTPSTPYQYFYRRRLMVEERWTPWEKIDLDIEADLMSCVIFNRRLYLFWCAIAKKQMQESVTAPEPGEVVPSPEVLWEVTPYWSTFWGGKWTPKRKGEEITTSVEPRWASAHDKNGTLVWMVDSVPADLETVPSLAFAGCGGEPAFAWQTRPTVPVLINARRARQYMVKLLDSDSEDGSLYLPTGYEDSAILRTPWQYRLAFAHHQHGIVAGDPCFYINVNRTFFVLPASFTPRWSDLWPFIPWLGYGDLALDLDRYVYVQPPVVDPWGPVARQDPYAYQPSYPVYAQQAITAGTARMAAGGTSARVLTVGRNAFEALPKPPVSTAPALASELMTDLAVGIHGFFPVRLLGWSFEFQTFYHPYVCMFVRELNRHGIRGFLQRKIQVQPEAFVTSPPIDFDAVYDPTARVMTPYPKEDVDFLPDGAYSQYNWELFFHAPLMIAERLAQNQRFEEAIEWFHFIFDPTDASSLPVPDKFWRTKPFHQTTAAQYQRERILNILQSLASGSPDPAFVQQVREWRAHPFDPHRIAALRTTAYQRSVVMKYIDTLIAWGDQLFRRDTIETVNEATQLYLLAAEILGRKPDDVKPRAAPVVQTFNTIEASLRPDDFSDPIVQVESFIPPSGMPVLGEDRLPPLMPNMLYFCIPRNEKLRGYWETVGNRLFNIRHCRNIEGVFRQLPLFEPPIDPAMLIRAMAAGVDLSSALADVNAPLPGQRFQALIGKATELATELKTLGAALLSALEKRDAEALSLLRSGHELTMLKATRTVRQRQIDEAKEALAGIRRTREVTEERHNFYRDVAYLNASEMGQLAAMNAALGFQTAQFGFDQAANLIALLPNFKLGSPFSIGLTFGGDNIAQALRAFAGFMGGQANLANAQAAMAGIKGGHDRRFDDWKLQERLARRELVQIDRQIAAAEIRLAITERELENHEQQIANAQEADEFLRDKYTNRELYDWMVTQISTVFFQAYQLAYDAAKRCERAFRYDLALAESDYIRFGYWDSLKKGLLSGERLFLDLKRLELAYHDANRREYEITRHVSLASLHPAALMALRETRECVFSVPESLFDIDFPGHYMRRVKTIGVTIPCVTGPYTGVPATLTLLGSTVRVNNSLAGGYARTGPEDSRFNDGFGSVQSIVTSSGQNDSGMFEMSLRDERYLPFEGAGAVSQWRLRLPSGPPPFDYRTITDVVLHVRYTAREGGDAMRDAARQGLLQALAQQVVGDGRRGLYRLFSLRHEFPTEWHRFLTSPDAAGDRAQALDFSVQRFPFLASMRPIRIRRVHVFALTTDATIAALDVYVSPPGEVFAAATHLVGLSNTPEPVAMLAGSRGYGPGTEKQPGNWTVTIQAADFAAVAGRLADLAVAVEYSLAP